MTRRSLLRFLAAAPAALALDPERLLWTPGKKLISIAAPRVVLKPGEFLIPMRSPMWMVDADGTLTLTPRWMRYLQEAKHRSA